MGKCPAPKAGSISRFRSYKLLTEPQSSQGPAMGLIQQVPRTWNVHMSFGEAVCTGVKWTPLGQNWRQYQASMRDNAPKFYKDEMLSDRWSKDLLSRSALQLEIVELLNLQSHGLVTSYAKAYINIIAINNR
jgi:hypothetical protein